MRSLRTVLLLGLAVLNTAVIGGLIATVYVRSRKEAERNMREDLRFRATTLAGVLEIDADGLEFEAAPGTMPDYEVSGSGAYCVIYDPAGNAVVRSPSLGEQDVPAAGSWTDGGFAYAELDSGPDGIPCAAVTYAFLAAVEHDSASDGDWEAPDEAQRRYTIVVALDSRPRDRGLADLGIFLGLIGAGALGVTGLGGILVARRVLGPIHRMTAEAEQLTPEDTTRRLRGETVVEELGSLADTLNSALDRLGDALDRQRRFTSDASHELRTPLAVLLGNVELLLRRERDGAEYRNGLERQRRIALRMTEITENLLALARADDGRAQVAREPVALAHLVRGVCDDFEAMAGEKGIPLGCVADDALIIDGDAMYLGLLVQNLLSNAVKFTPAGGAVRIRLGRDGDSAVLDVADTGPGVPRGHREHVFDRFFRIQHGRDGQEGAGLGLAIVQWIVQAHEGTIEVLEHDGGGALFRVRLPLSRETVGAVPEAPADVLAGAASQTA